MHWAPSKATANLANTFGFAGSASFYMSGLSYWAAKDGFRTITDAAGISRLRSRPRPMSSTSRNMATRALQAAAGPARQYWLSAKYGGVDTFDASGNPQNWSRTMPGYTGAWPQDAAPGRFSSDIIAAVRGALSSPSPRKPAPARLSVC